jgi:hypothetical protein
MVPRRSRGWHNARVLRLVIVAALALTLTTGCARPYGGPRTLAAIGAGLLLAGGAAWIAGERSSHTGLVNPGFAATVVGAGAVVGAAAWMAATVSCRVDPDCPEGEECKEVPAPPGGIPYRQCRRR